MSKDADITFSGAELLISSRRSETAGLSGKVAGCLTQRLGHIVVNVTFSKRWEIKTISLSLSNVIRVLPQTTRVRFRLMLTFLFVCGSLKTQLLCLFLSASLQIRSHSQTHARQVLYCALCLFPFSFVMTSIICNVKGVSFVLFFSFFV